MFKIVDASLMIRGVCYLGAQFPNCLRRMGRIWPVIWRRHHGACSHQNGADSIKDAIGKRGAGMMALLVVRREYSQTSLGEVVRKQVFLIHIKYILILIQGYVNKYIYAIIFFCMHLSLTTKHSIYYQDHSMFLSLFDSKDSTLSHMILQNSSSVSTNARKQIFLLSSFIPNFSEIEIAKLILSREFAPILTNKSAGFIFSDFKKGSILHSSVTIVLQTNSRSTLSSPNNNRGCSDTFSHFNISLFNKIIDIMLCVNLFLNNCFQQGETSVFEILCIYDTMNSIELSMFCYQK